MRNRTTTLITLVLALVLVGCSSPNAAPPAAPQVSVEGAWTRTTTGAKDPTMTAVFLTIVNPGSADVRLVGADCARAGVVQIHDMVTVDGRLVMQQVEGGVVVPSGSHLHLTPGGKHIMLMQLPAPLRVGERVALTLHFSDGASVDVSAPVKEFVEEEDHYHSPSPSPSA